MHKKSQLLNFVKFMQRGGCFYRVKCNLHNNRIINRIYADAKYWYIGGYKNNIFLHSRMNCNEEIY